MKTHTTAFKNQIKEFGREIDSVITYTQSGVTTELGVEELNSVTPSFEGNILKSVMKQLEIDSNVNIPLNTIINYRFGVKVRNNTVLDYRDNYDYVDFGNYVVYSSEKQEDLNSYKILCYDKMLYSMVEYDGTNITYPITIRDYISTICTKLGLTFKNSQDTFVNYDKIIQNELYIAEDGGSLDYTFRDVFDELAQATASTICINEEDDELEIRYINETNDTINEECLKDINVNFGLKYGPVNSIVLSRAEGSDNIYEQDNESIAEYGLCELKISDNQIMNFDDRDEYLQGIFNELNGLEYYVNDFSSTGICYYNLCDAYNVEIDNNTYNCIILNDEVNITQGLEELIHTDLLEESETDYTKSDKTDRRIKKTTLIVDKANQQITSLVVETEQLNDTVTELGTRYTQSINQFEYQITQLNDKVDETNEDFEERIDTLENTPAKGLKTLSVVINDSGLNVSTNTSKISSLMTNYKFAIQDNLGTELTFIGYDENLGRSVSRMDNLTVTNYLNAGYHRQQKFEINGENRTGWFYIGGE